MIEKLYLAKPRGFCAGVVMAIEAVERSANEMREEKQGELTVYHAIVHNNTVVDRLEQQHGVHFVEDLDELQTLAAKSKNLLARVDDAVARHGDLEFSHRIATMDERIEPHRLRVDRAISQSESQIRKLAIAQLEQQESELSRALGQSRLAIARLYDESSAERSP